MKWGGRNVLLMLSLMFQCTLCMNMPFKFFFNVWSFIFLLAAFSFIVTGSILCPLQISLFVGVFVYLAKQLKKDMDKILILVRKAVFEK